VVVQYGWPDPLEVCLDPALAFAPRFMRERMDTDAGAVEVTTRWSHFDEVLDGIWLAQRVERRQAPIGPGGTVERPYLVIDLTAERVALNRPVVTCFDVAALFPPDARVVDRWTGTIVAGAEAGRAVAAARAALAGPGGDEAAP
jgi:hypothetical protein